MANKVLTATCGIVAAAGLSFGAAAIANASTPAASTAPSTTYSNGYGALTGTGGRGSTDAAVSGTELANVKAAVKAKDSAVTVSEVRKDSDGSYDVFGTKAGNRVMLEVSKDLKTITTGPGRGPGGHGGGHGSNDAAVSGTELANVKAAVKAKDSAVTVSEVRKDSDGSYDVFGTKAGNRVMLEVSKDLKTITANSFAPR
jgi:hypothetical protein